MQKYIPKIGIAICLFALIIIFLQIITGCASASVPVPTNSTSDDSHKYAVKYAGPNSSTFDMYQIPVDNKFGKVVDIEPDYHDGVVTVKYMSSVSGIETAIIYDMSKDNCNIRYGYQIQTNNKGE